MSPVAQTNGHVNGHAHTNGYGQPPTNAAEEAKAFKTMKTLDGVSDLDVRRLSMYSSVVYLLSWQPSKLVLNLTEDLKPLPEPTSLVFGQVRNIIQLTALWLMSNITR